MKNPECSGQELPGHNIQGDSHTNAILSASLKEYVEITRIWLDRQIIAVRTDNEDFIRWA